MNSYQLLLEIIKNLDDYNPDNFDDYIIRNRKTIETD